MLVVVAVRGQTCPALVQAASFGFVVVVAVAAAVAVVSAVAERSSYCGSYDRNSAVCVHRSID